MLQQKTLIKVLPIKGRLRKRMLLVDYIALMEERARSQERQRFLNLRRRQFQAM